MQTDYIIELLQDLTTRIVSLTRKVDALTALCSAQNSGGTGNG